MLINEACKINSVTWQPPNSDRNWVFPCSELLPLSGAIAQANAQSSGSAQLYNILQFCFVYTFRPIWRISCRITLRLRHSLSVENVVCRRGSWKFAWRMGRELPRLPMWAIQLFHRIHQRQFDDKRTNSRYGSIAFLIAQLVVNNAIALTFNWNWLCFIPPFSPWDNLCQLACFTIHIALCYFFTRSGSIADMVMISDMCSWF